MENLEKLKAILDCLKENGIILKVESSGETIDTVETLKWAVEMLQ